MNLKHHLTPSKKTRRSLDPRRPRALAFVALTFIALLAALSPAASAAGDLHPTVPTNLTISDVTASSMRLSWAPSTDDVGVVGYQLYKNGAAWSQSTGTWVIFGAGIPLSCGTSYTFGVAAIDTVGQQSGVTSVIASTTPCADGQAPSAPAGVAQIAKTSNSATISWNASSDNVGVVGYGAYQGGIRVAETAQTSYTFANLSCGTSTTVGLDAYDAAGNRSSQTSFVVTTSPCNDTQSPTNPTNLAKTSSTDTSISLSWSASSDNVGVVSYSILANGALVGSTGSTSYTISGLTCGASYTIGIEAYDAAGNHSQRTQATMGTSSCPAPPPPSGGDTAPPSTPTGLVVKNTTQSSIRIDWVRSTDNVGVVGYDLYRNGASWSQTTGTMAIFGAGIPLSCGTSYTFGVKAYDAAGNRSGLTSIIASTSPCSDAQPPTTPSNLTLASRTATSISLSWSPSADNVGVVGYGVYKGGVTAGSSATTSYTVTGLVCGTTYTIGVDAYDASGNRSSQSVVMMATSGCFDTTPPSAPTNLTTSNVGPTAATLSWTASTDNVGVTGYDVFANGTKVGGSTTATSNALAGLTCNTAYTLGVEAFDGAGNRSTRATKAVTTAACAPQTGASVYLAPSGNDANACTATAPCRTFDRAYRAAQPGATVDVAGGLYPATDPGANTVRINRDASKTSSTDVVFRCTSGSNVNFDAANFTIIASHITFQGSCFRFRSLWTGQSGDSSADSDDLTFDGVHMAGFEIIGSSNITIRNSEVGPNVACYTNGDSSKPSSSWCQNNSSTGEDWYYQHGQCNCGVYEPKIQPNSGGNFSNNIVLENNWIHDQQTRASDSNVGGSYALHNGGMLIEESCACSITLRGNRFERNVTYDIQGDPSPRGVTVENNSFGAPYNTLDQGASKILGFKAIDLTLRTNGQTSLSDWLIRFNSMETGLRIGDGATWQSYSNVRVVGNIWGSGQQCLAGTSGVSYDSNAVVSSTCGSSSQSLGSLPFVSTGSAIDFHLTGGAAVDSVKSATADASIASDVDGQSRPMGSGRDAGADESA